MLVNNTSTTSKRSLWPEETRGLWVVEALGSKLKLSNGLWYDDWASALGANTLGYGALKGDFTPAASLPWQIEHDFAERFCAAMGTEAVRFFKSGSDAVSCAVRLARAYTERKFVIVFDKSYHGTGDWFGQALWTQGGIVPTFLMMHPFGQPLPDTGYWANDIAAIVVEPVPKSIDLPPNGWLQHLREVCDEHGILLISDEVILGYRYSLSGYLGVVGVRADLSCYGKAMAQGAALSACTGRRDIMEQLRDHVHFSGTNNGEPLALHTAKLTLVEYQQRNVCDRLSGQGSMLRAMLTDAGFATRGLNSRFEVTNTEYAVKHCFDRGILFPGFCSMAVTHTFEQMTKLVEILKSWRKQTHVPNL